ncbi:MAG TPA: hypothetical protein VGD65_11045 [Chryseosolibacter sp.]
MFKAASLPSISVFFIMMCLGNAQAQNYDGMIQGRWVTQESILKKEIEHSSESPYLQYEFGRNQVLSYGTSQYELGHRSEYTIVGNTIRIFNSEYLIDGTGDVLTLTAKNPSNPVYRINLIRKEQFDEVWSKHSPSIKISSYTFTAKFSLYDYVFSYSNSPDEYERNILLHHHRPLPPRYDEYLKIKFAFDSSSNVVVIDVDGLPKPSTANAAKIKRRFENTTGYWINHVTHQLRTDTLELTFLVRGKSSLDFREKAVKHFNRAAEYYAKNNFMEGLNMINKAIALQDDNSQFYILRSLLFFKLDNLDKYCGDIVKANSINPFVRLSQTEVVDGESVEIKCTAR